MTNIKALKLKVIVFDLDDTLLDTSSLLIPIAEQPAYFEKIKSPLPLMPGAKQNLQQLSSQYQLSLLTQGDKKIQQQKIESLNCSHYFQKIYIVDPSLNENKEEAFQRVIQDFAILPKQLLSIGNRRSTDLRPAKKLGAMTCLFVFGEHQFELPATPEDRPDFEVHNHFELAQLCQLN